MYPLAVITPITSIIGFVLGFPTSLATYYQAWKTRQESKEARQGIIFSRNCLEFITEDGTSVNLVPLETLHSLPKPGDIVLLPGPGLAAEGHSHLPPSAYRVGRVEHIYARVEDARSFVGQARLVKAVAHVDALHRPASTLNSIAHLPSDTAPGDLAQA